MSSAKTTEEELTPDGYESLFDGRETERVANLIIGAPGPDTLKRGASIDDVHINCDVFTALFLLLMCEGLPHIFCVDFI